MACDAAVAQQKVKLLPGDVVLIRTGTLRHWGTDGDDHAKIGQHDSAGITLETAKYLVEQHGAIMIGSDAMWSAWVCVTTKCRMPS